MLKQQIRIGRLEVIDAEGLRYAYDGASGPAVRIRLRSPSAYSKLLLQPALAIGESYVNGDLTLERGSLYDLVDLFARNFDGSEGRFIRRFTGMFENGADRLRAVLSGPGAERSAELSDEFPAEFHRLFLDEDRQCSRGYFCAAEGRSDGARETRRAQIVSKLRLQPGLEVLDMGCGCGDLSLDLAAHYGARVVGIPLFREQVDVCRRRAGEAGLSDRVRFEFCDYRDIRGRFDRIVSVGMFEHVGFAAYEGFISRFSTLLREGGVALIHSMGRMQPPGTRDSWTGGYMFPGAYIPALSEVLGAVENTGLWCTDLEILRLHYAETVRTWRRRFQTHRDEAQKSYGESFCRKWEFYLAGAEVSFRRMRQMIFQMQLTRKMDAVPLATNCGLGRGSRELEGVVESEQLENHQGLRRHAHESDVAAVRADPLV